MDARLDEISASRNDGVLALFSGADGSGRKQAAHDLAAAVKAPLQIVELVPLIDKHLTEVEQLIDKEFDEARRTGAVLLFDEADALFGKRTDVRDAHDRYANLEVSDLLERIEAYRGIVILATSKQQDLDPALVRQCRFTLGFTHDRAS